MMKAKLLKKLRRKYSSDYKICKTYNWWEVYEKSWYNDIYTYRLLSTSFETKEKALAHIRKLVDLSIESYLIEHRCIDVTSKMLYG